jgi:hypothetical protein
MPKRADHHTFEDPTSRPALLREGWKAIARVFVLAILMDFIYQMIVLPRLYPLQLLLVAVLLAVAPYLLIRGPVNRIARRLRGTPQPIQRSMDN